MIFLYLSLRLLLVYALIRRGRPGWGISLILITVPQLLYVPIYGQGGTVLDAWKYEFIRNRTIGAILWNDVALMMLLWDVLLVVHYAGFLLLTRIIKEVSREVDPSS